MAVSQTSYNACLWINDSLSIIENQSIEQSEKKKMIRTWQWKKPSLEITSRNTFLVTQILTCCWPNLSLEMHMDKEILVGQTFGSTPEYMSFDCRYWKDITIWHILANRKRLTGDTAKNRFIIFCVISTFDLLETFFLCVSKWLRKLFFIFFFICPEQSK